MKNQIIIPTELSVDIKSFVIKVKSSDIVKKFIDFNYVQLVLEFVITVLVAFKKNLYIYYRYIEQIKYLNGSNILLIDEQCMHRNNLKENISITDSEYYWCQDSVDISTLSSHLEC